MNQAPVIAPKKKGAPFGNTNGAGKTNAINHKSVIERRLADRAAMVQIADALIDQAIEGNMTAINTLFDRVMGKAVQHVETSSESTVKHEYNLSEGTQAMLLAMRQAMIQHQAPAQNAERVIDTISIVIDPDA